MKIEWLVSHQPPATNRHSPPTTSHHLLKTKWWITNITAVRSLTDRNVKFWSDLGHFFVNSGRLCDQGATLRSGNPLLSPNNFIQGPLMKIELLVSNVTAVGSPDKAQRDILGMILDACWRLRAAFADGEPLCDVGIPSWALIPLFWAIHLK